MAKQVDKILYNRIKSELADANTSNQELAEKLQVAEETVSSWCTNSAQPSVKRLFAIAKILDINVQKLLVPTESKNKSQNDVK